MLATLKHGILVLIIVTAWTLFWALLLDYIGGDLAAALPQVPLQAHVGLLLLVVMLSRSAQLRRVNRSITQWLSSTALGALAGGKTRHSLTLVKSGLRSFYINLYLSADVLFCVGAPLLIIAASAGWWLIDEVSYVALLLYCCLISIIFFAGLCSNLVRLLALGYFFGYWLLSTDMLMYPFIAPAVVQTNIANMMTDAFNALLPVIGLVLIVYLLVRRHGVQIFSKPFSFSRNIFSNYLLLICLVMATPLAAIVANMVVVHINIHMLFFGLGIWILDNRWQEDAAREPALSSDWRYFLNLSWKH